MRIICLFIFCLNFCNTFILIALLFVESTRSKKEYINDIHFYQLFSIYSKQTYSFESDWVENIKNKIYKIGTVTTRSCSWGAQKFYWIQLFFKIFLLNACFVGSEYWKSWYKSTYLQRHKIKNSIDIWFSLNREIVWCIQKKWKKNCTHYCLGESVLLCSVDQTINWIHTKSTTSIVKLWRAIEFWGFFPKKSSEFFHWQKHSEERYLRKKQISSHACTYEKSFVNKL